MIDSHCHLAAKEFKGDLSDVLSRAAAAGIEKMITIADTMQEGRDCQKIAKAHTSVFFTMGVHPHHAKDFIDADLAEIRSIAVDPKCKAIGEIGLDYHYNFSPKDVQQKVFEVQLNLAKELNLPAVVHCREAVEDLWAIVNHVKPQSLVIHCCTEKWEDVERFVKAGYFLSFTGIATYPKSDDIRRTIEMCPINQLMIETDAPFLAPVPHRGKRNEPAYVAEVLKTVANIKKMSLEEADRATTANTVQFFSLRS